MWVYSDVVISRDEALATLRRTDAAAGVAWAFDSACEQILEDFTGGIGYGPLTAGVARYELVADRLDRVFSCGNYEVEPGMEFEGLDIVFGGLSERAQATMPMVTAGVVTRSNLNGSNGWSVGGFRFITHAFELGQQAGIDWTTATKTVQAVSRQEPFGTFTPVTLLDQILTAEARVDLAAHDALPFVGIPTLVLGHALDLTTSERELLIGHSRYNVDLGNPWHWTQSLLEGTGGGSSWRPHPGVVPPQVAEPDVTVRLRPNVAENTQ